MGIDAIYLRLNQNDLNKILTDENGEALDEMFESGALPTLELGRCWNELHILLTGQDALSAMKNGGATSPLSEAIIGGTEIECSEGGYGPRRYLTPAQVRAIAEQLEKLQYDTVASANKVNTGVSEDIMQEYFDDFKEFYRNASREQQVVVSSFD